MINAFSSLRTNFWEVPSPIVVTKASPLRRPTNNVRLFILLKQRGLKLPSKVTQLKIKTRIMRRFCMKTGSLVRKANRLPTRMINGHQKVFVDHRKSGSTFFVILISRHLQTFQRMKEFFIFWREWPRCPESGLSWLSGLPHYCTSRVRRWKSNLITTGRIEWE